MSRKRDPIERMPSPAEIHEEMGRLLRRLQLLRRMMLLSHRARELRDEESHTTTRARHGEK